MIVDVTGALKKLYRCQQQMETNISHTKSKYNKSNFFK